MSKNKAFIVWDSKQKLFVSGPHASKEDAEQSIARSKVNGAETTDTGVEKTADFTIEEVTVA